jgi:MIP family channel proteins
VIDPRRALGAELLGTFVLVLFGCGAVMVDAEGGALGTLGVALAFGLAVGVLVFTLGHVSGHFNPAVTLALAVGGSFRRDLVLPYWAAQLAGAVLAAAVLRLTLGDVADLGATLPSGSDAESFAWEGLLTFTLVLVVARVVMGSEVTAGVAGAAVGAAVGLGALVGGPISGGSMNPARSLGPALVSGTFDSLWIYVTAPFAGGLVAVAAFLAVSPRER